MERRNFIRSVSAAGIAAVGLSTAGCLGGENNEDSDPEPDASGNNSSGGTGAAGDARSDLLELEGEITADSVGGLEVVERNIYETTNGTGLTGIVENTGDQPYEFVEVNVTMYDDANEILYEFVDESEEAEIDGIFGPGERWRFNVRFQEVNDPSNIVRYTLQLNGDVAESVSVNATNMTDGNATGNMTGNATDGNSS